MISTTWQDLATELKDAYVGSLIEDARKARGEDLGDTASIILNIHSGTVTKYNDGVSRVVVLDGDEANFIEMPGVANPLHSQPAGATEITPMNTRGRRDAEFIIYDNPQGNPAISLPRERSYG